MISDNIKHIKHSMAMCCEKIGRSPDEVTLICVTKGMPLDKIMEAVDAGVTELGENRVQELLYKSGSIGSRVKWHLIGHLQTNKVKDAVKIADLIHSVDSVRLAEAIDREAARAEKRQAILLQVNTSGEASKFGIDPDEVDAVFEEISSYAHLDIQGLMTMAPEAENPEEVRPFFYALRQIRDHLSAADSGLRPLKNLSMGMSNDFKVAIEEGATMVRIGRAIFGS